MRSRWGTEDLAAALRAGLGRGQEADQKASSQREDASKQKRTSRGPLLVRRGRTCGSDHSSFNPNKHFWALSGKLIKRSSREEANNAPWRAGSATWGPRFPNRRTSESEPAPRASRSEWTRLPALVRRPMAMQADTCRLDYEKSYLKPCIRAAATWKWPTVAEGPERGSGGVMCVCACTCDW